MKYPFVALLTACLLFSGCGKHGSPGSAATELQRAHDEEGATADLMVDQIATVDQKIEALGIQRRTVARAEKFRADIEGAQTDDARLALDRKEVAAARAETAEIKAALDRWKRQPK